MARSLSEAAARTVSSAALREVARGSTTKGSCSAKLSWLQAPAVRCRSKPLPERKISVLPVPAMARVRLSTVAVSSTGSACAV